MIHGKKRNGDLFKRLTESWGYTKSETNEEEVIPLDEEMAADTETVTEEEEVAEEEEEVQTEGGMYKRDDDEELEEIEARNTPRKTNGRRPENAMADRVREEEEPADGEEIVAEADEEVVEEDTDTTDNLEEAIRKVVKEAIKTYKANKQGSK